MRRDVRGLSDGRAGLIKHILADLRVKYNEFAQIKTMSYLSDMAVGSERASYAKRHSSHFLT